MSQSGVLGVTPGVVFHWSGNLGAVGCGNFCGGLEGDTA